MSLNSKIISTTFLTLPLLFIGIIMAVYVAINPSGAIVALVPLMSIIFTILALTKPKTGLYCLAALVIWVDEFKRLAVYFGGSYSTTVIQTLAMPFILLAALNIGFFINVSFDVVKLKKINILIYTFGLIAGAAVFASADGELTTRCQRAASISGYLTLIPISCAYLRSFDEWRKFIAFQSLLAVPAAAWAIKQYFFGFDTIEWEYARSGLSPVHYTQMFEVSEKPRVFGFFGSASALGCAAIYFTFSAWHMVRYGALRYMWMLVALVYFTILVASEQRTALIYPLIVFLTAYAFRTKIRTIVLYAAAGLTLITGVLSSKFLLEEGIGIVNNAIAVDSDWGRSVFTVDTFSDRLRGWIRLSKPNSWSLFGKSLEKTTNMSVSVDYNSEDYNHDVINKILISYGAVGLLSLIIPSAFTLVVIHGTILSIPKNSFRNDAALSFALSIPVIGLSLVGGDNFATNPINLQIWTCFAGVLICRKQMIKNKSSSLPNTQDL